MALSTSVYYRLQLRNTPRQVVLESVLPPSYQRKITEWHWWKRHEKGLLYIKNDKHSIGLDNSTVYSGI